MRKRETMTIKQFTTGEYKKPKRRERKVNSFIFVNPMAFVDPTVCTITGIILLIALLEKFLANKEYYEGMKFINGLMDVVLPVGGIAALVFFLMEVVS